MNPWPVAGGLSCWRLSAWAPPGRWGRCRSRCPWCPLRSSRSVGWSRPNQQQQQINHKNIWLCLNLVCVYGIEVKYGGRSPKFIWVPCHVMCTHWLRPRNVLLPPFGLRALLVSKERRNLFETPWSIVSALVNKLFQGFSPKHLFCAHGKQYFWIYFGIINKASFLSQSRWENVIST